jgi:hypothetical protein
MPLVPLDKFRRNRRGEIELDANGDPIPLAEPKPKARKHYSEADERMLVRAAERERELQLRAAKIRRDEAMLQELINRQGR